MTMQHQVRTSLVLSALLTLWGSASAAPMTKSEFDSAKTRIGADYKSDKAACDSLAMNAKDICIEEAKGKEKVAYAELDFTFSGKPADHTKVLVAKAESAYAVAKERCDDKAGNDKDVCVKEAKAAETTALADAKAGKKISEARKDAAADKRDAEYKVAAEKCEALAGEAKAACVSAAKSKFGKA
ncbi:hypothetical protein ABT392_21670 [Paucibacter sp. JuS9]|uniref:hypothetical protein n=1 Tax=Roseateles TaxID=93681 RepID=UPI002FE6AAC3